MEMEVPVENNISIGNGISNTMPLHVNRTVPVGLGMNRGESRERDGRERDPNNIGGNGYLNNPSNMHGQQSQPQQQQNATSHGFGPPSYGSGIVTNNYYTPVTVAPSATLPPSAHPRDRGDVSTNSSSHREREREIIRESIGNRPPPMLKVAVVGESTVGKSAVCNVFTVDTSAFTKNYNLTCGVDIYAKNIKLPPTSSSSPPTGNTNPVEEGVNLVLLDSSGKDLYFDLLPRYWDKIDGVALVIDLTLASSLENAQRWLDLAKGSISNAPSSSADNFLGVLIGNKSDLTEQRTVSPKMAKDFAQKYNLEYFECSAKENNGLEEPFFYLAHQWTSRGAESGSGVVGIKNSSSNKENHRDGSHRAAGISSVGSTRHSAFQRKSSSNNSQQGSMEFI